MHRAAVIVLLAAALAAIGNAGASRTQRTLPKPKLTPIRAVFDPAPQGVSCAPPYCETTYTEKAKGKGLDYSWKVRIPTDRKCAKGFLGNRPHKNAATWYHADVTEGGYCDHSKYNASGSGHPGTVTVRVTNADWSCKATFRGTQGPQAQLSWNGPRPKKCRRL